MLLKLALFVLMAAGLVGFGAVAWLGPRPPPAPPVLTVEAVPVAPPVQVAVLVAARTLRPGALLKAEDVTTALVTQSTAPEGARIDTPAARAELLGAMLRHTVLTNEVLLPIHVMRAGDRGFLAAVLGPGLRAATVGVNSVTGTAGLIWPGDHVDLILTQTLDDPAAPAGRRIAGETVLHNVRVIAIDQELMQGATAAAGSSTGQTRTVTLEVSPDNAERVAVATRLGHLSLSVISADPSEVPRTPEVASAVAARAPITWGGDVSPALQAGRKADPSSASIRLYLGGADSKEIHF